MRPYELYRKEDTSFISQYVEWARTLTDACVEFHMAAAFALLATVCGSYVTYPAFGGRVCWPNLYVVLIGQSGIARKSTIIGMVDSILTEISPSLVIRGEQSREAFLTALSNHPNVLLPLSEFASSIRLWSREYQAGFREIVTDLYDPHLEYRRQLMKEQVIINRPAINIFAGSTPDWLRESLTGGDLRGGFMGRFLIFPSGPKEPDPGLPENQKWAGRKNIIDFLKAILMQGNRNVRLDKVKKDYRLWLKSEEEKLALQDEEMAGFFSRVPAHCLKLLVLDTIASYGPKPDYYEPQLENLNRAITLTNWLVSQAIELTQNNLNAGKWELQAQKVLGYASRNGGISHSDLLKRMRIPATELQRYIDTLIQRDELEVLRNPTGGRVSVTYRRKKREESIGSHKQDSSTPAKEVEESAKKDAKEVKEGEQ